MLECRDEHEEARLVSEEIVKTLRERPASDVAVFYRVNAQSRVLEDMLVRQGIGYRVIGGTKFYQRAEIKDLLAYLRVMVNESDDLSLLRVVNTPRRGLGDIAVGRLKGYDREQGIPLREALGKAARCRLTSGPPRPACGWEGFVLGGGGGCDRGSAAATRRPRPQSRPAVPVADVVAGSWMKAAHRA